MVLGDGPVLTKDVIDAALKMAGDFHGIFVNPLFRDALTAVAGDARNIDKDALGAWIGRHKERSSMAIESSRAPSATATAVGASSE